MSDFHLPGFATVSGETPVSKSSVAPPGLELWPWMWLQFKGIQISWHLSRNHCLTMGAQEPSAVQNVNSGALSGVFLLDVRYAQSASTGQRASWAVKIRSVPFCFSIFPYEMWKWAEDAPPGWFLKEMGVDLETCKWGSKELWDGIVSSLMQQHPQKAPKLSDVQWWLGGALDRGSWLLSWKQKIL